MWQSDSQGMLTLVSFEMRRCVGGRSSKAGSPGWAAAKQPCRSLTGPSAERCVSLLVIRPLKCDRHLRGMFCSVEDFGSSAVALRIQDIPLVKGVKECGEAGSPSFVGSCKACPVQRFQRPEHKGRSLRGRLGAPVPSWMVQARQCPPQPALRMASKGE